MTRNAPVHAFITTVDQLVAVMDTEIELLREMRTRDIAELQARKVSLVASYERLAAQLQEDPELLPSLEPELREELLEVSEVLQDAIRDNEAALRAATRANERLLKTIVEALQQEQNTYGSMGQAPARAGSPTVSVQIDQRL